MAVSLPAAPPSYPPTIPEAEVETYKTIGETALRVWIFNPEGHQAEDRRPALVFFFGGGWTRGNPSQFRPQAEYLAGRGMVAILADYRVRSRHGVTVNQCVEDAKAAIRWVRSEADRLGIDPDRIAAGGGSAGGHLAAATATLPGYDDPHEDQSVSARPNALVLFNPAVVLSNIPGQFEFPQTRIDSMKERLGVEPESLSPYHHIEPGMPPTILFHGTADQTVSIKTVELFSEKMKAAGNRCELVRYEGAGHGFFNPKGGKNKAYADTVAKMDAFLGSLDYLAELPVGIAIK